MYDMLNSANTSPEKNLTAESLVAITAGKAVVAKKFGK